MCSDGLESELRGLAIQEIRVRVVMVSSLSYEGLAIGRLGCVCSDGFESELRGPHSAGLQPPALVSLPSCGPPVLPAGSPVPRPSAACAPAIVIGR